MTGLQRAGRAVSALALSAALLPRPAAAQRQIPSPESVLGFSVGADFKLATYEESVRYFQALAAAAPDRVRLVEVGKTSLGRPWTLAIISSAQNLANLDRYRDIAQRLAHPAGLTEEEAAKLAAAGKAFVDVSGGLHASEVAGAQHTIQLAYHLLATTGDPTIAAILDNVVLFLWPSLNPDGQDIVVNWYRENVGTPYEAAPLHELYQKYVGHDNNRDAYMLNVPESRVVTRTWRMFEPQIIYVHHQSSPFPTRIWLPPFAEPIATETPPLMAREVNAIGMLMAQALETRGQLGATHMGDGFDAWYPGYIDYLPMLQHIAAYWTETALYRYATPYFYTMSDFPAELKDLRAQSLYPSPWPGGWWRLGDAVDYMETASIATLDYAAKFREQLLLNRYRSGRDAIRRYQREPPYAYLVPRDQRDPTAAVELLWRLAFNGVKVESLSRAATLEGVTWPAGTWVIPMGQEFAPLVKQLLEPQRYPDLREYPGGPPEQPYDAAGWTLPYLMDVRVVAVRSPLSEEFRAASAPVSGSPVEWTASPDAGFRTNPVAAGIAAPAGRIGGGGGAAVGLSPAENNTFRAVSRALRAGGTVRRAADGRYLVSGVAQGTLDAWVRELALRGERTSAGGAAVRSRVGLYQSWQPSMDAGWTEWLLDQYEVGHAPLSNADLQAGRLNERVDVIVLAADYARLLLDGYAKGTVPARYEGGIGPVGVRALDEFVRAGGTLVCLNQAGNFAIEQLHLPVENVVAKADRKEFFASGSILEVTADTTHPVMAGMPERSLVFFDGSPVFTTQTSFEGSALAKYREQGNPLASGYLLGAERLNGYAAALDVKLGRGHVLLLGFRPQWRGQTWGTFRVLLNAALFGGEVAQSARGAEGFWTAPTPKESKPGADAKPAGRR